MFPAPPDEPRIQYLTSFGSETDLGSQGTFKEFVVGRDKIYRPIWKPYGVAIKGGKVYVCDTQGANVSIADLKRRKLQYVKPSGLAALQMPVSVAVDDDGRFFVSDSVRGQVMVFDKEANPVTQIGRVGEMKPAGLALHGDRLYVGDMSNCCVRVYDKKSYALVSTFPQDRSDEKARLLGPTNLAIDSEGNIYVSDSKDFRVKLYDANGKHLRTFGEMGVTPGQFALPKGIGVDREKRFYVLDAAAPVIQLFDHEGKLLMFFGQPNQSGPAGLYLPAGLFIDYENRDLFQKFVAPGFTIEYLILVTNQVGPNKVSVFAFVKKK
jgi:DNA-binding beta-propeller fold protein YncE